MKSNLNPLRNAFLNNELLTVACMILMLSSLFFWGYVQQDQARSAQSEAEFVSRVIERQVDRFYLENGRMPDSRLEELVQRNSKSHRGSSYLPAIPVNPLVGTNQVREVEFLPGKSDPKDSRTGWYYNSRCGKIWPNFPAK